MCILCDVGYTEVTHDANGDPAGGIPPYGTRSTISHVVDTDLNDADQNVDALIRGTQWDLSASNIITFSFPDSAADYSYSPGAGINFASAFSTVQEDAARSVLFEVSSFTNLVFDEIGNNIGENNAEGTLRFANVTGINTAFGYYPNSGESGGDMAFKDGAYTTPYLGSYQGMTVGHEIGHALGLKHGHDTSGPGAINTDQDSMEYSVMTYRSFAGQDMVGLPFYVNAKGHYAQSAMMLDIAALQRMYGANHNTASGDTVYTFDPTTGQMLMTEDGIGVRSVPSSYVNSSGTRVFTNVTFRTIWDGDGEDTYDLSNFNTNLMIDLTPGGYVDLGVGTNVLRAELNSGFASNGNGGYYYDHNAKEYARGHVFNALQHNGDARSLIENANGGSGNDIFIGNAANNVLNGYWGNDSFYGGDGNDTLIGGAGVDRYSGGAGNDTIHFGAGDARWISGGAGNDMGGAGYDTLILEEGVSFNVANVSVFGFEAVQGNKWNNFIQGLDNTVDYNFSGGEGHDTLNGAGGNDTLNGGADNDTLRGGDGHDTLTGGAGVDRYSGGAGNDTIHFGAGDARWISGGAGNDMGGAGYDTLILEEGASFNVTNVSAFGFEAVQGNSSNNFIQGLDNSVDYNFSGWAGNDTLIGAGGNDTLNGGAGSDSLYGGDGNDTLTGFTGVDRYSGGAGNDTIHFGAGDARWISGGAGNDMGGAGYDTLILEEGASFNVTNVSAFGFEAVQGNSSNNFIQGLDNTVDYNFSGGGGSDTLNGAGGNDMLFGDAGNDNLRGGAGDDTLIGGAGVDRYSGGAGNDTIQFGAGDARWISGGAGNDMGGAGYDTLELEEGAEFNSNNFAIYGIEAVRGNSSNNTFGGMDDAVDYQLFGFGGDDTLTGAGGEDMLWGGTGTDVMTGNGGDDWFLFTVDFGADRVTDFDNTADKLLLDTLLIGAPTMTDAAFLSAYASTDGLGNTLISIGSNVLTLDGMSDVNDLLGRIDFFEFT